MVVLRCRWVESGEAVTRSARQWWAQALSLASISIYEALLRPWPAAVRNQPSYTAMRLRKHAPLFESPLKRVALHSGTSPLCNRCRRYASWPAYPERVAVLGGGISGLASAYYVSQEFPQSKITVHEANKDSGGWIQSRRVEVPGGNVLFEYGARTLRPGQDACITAQLVGTHASSRTPC